MLPAELQQPVPRELGPAGASIRKSKALAKGSMGIGLLISIAVCARVWLKYGNNPFTVGWLMALCVLLTGLFAAVGLALLWNTQRSERMFRDGNATLGQLVQLNVNPDPKTQVVWIKMTVRYADSAGVQHEGPGTMAGQPEKFTYKEGDQIPVLYMRDDPQHFSVYVPGFNIVVRTAT